MSPVGTTERSRRRIDVTSTPWPSPDRRSRRPSKGDPAEMVISKVPLADPNPLIRSALAASSDR